jgi:hypothetical protein
VHIFISYPRELETFANQLTEELKDQGISFFLDKESIGPGRWNLEVEKNIKKAKIFVVLYLPKADYQGRYFYEELEKIGEEFEKSKKLDWKKKIVIPVTFAASSNQIPSMLKLLRNYLSLSAESKQLPPFLKKHNAIETDVPGIKQSKNDGYWVRKIVKIIKDWEENKIFKWIRLVIVILLAISACGIFLFSYKEINEKTSLEEKLAAEKLKVEKKQKLINELERLRTGEYICNSLIGKYKLDHPYTFVEKNGFRTVGNVNSTWETDEKCVHDKHNNQYILKGKDTTFFDVQIFINKKYVTIATVKQEYPSEVFIDMEGKLLKRKFYATEYPPREENIADIKNENIVKLTSEQIIKEVKKVMSYRDEEHRKLETKGCSPLQGLKGGKTAVAFVCAHYTRVMEKK